MLDPILSPFKVASPTRHAGSDDKHPVLSKSSLEARDESNEVLKESVPNPVFDERTEVR